MKHQLHCHAMGNNEGWEAICVDFDIAVQGKTFDQVYETLNDAIASYIEDAHNESPAARAQLLGRRAPLFVRLKLAAIPLWLSLFGKDDNDDESRSFFTMHCPA